MFALVVSCGSKRGPDPELHHVDEPYRHRNVNAWWTAETGCNTKRVDVMEPEKKVWERNTARTRPDRGRGRGGASFSSSLYLPEPQSARRLVYEHTKGGNCAKCVR